MSSTRSMPAVLKASVNHLDLLKQFMDFESDKKACLIMAGVWEMDAATFDYIDDMVEDIIYPPGFHAIAHLQTVVVNRMQQAAGGSAGEEPGWWIDHVTADDVDQTCDVINKLIAAMEGTNRRS